MKETSKTITEYEKTCPNCGKVFTSQNKKQLEWNFDVHHRSCKLKSEVKNGSNG